MNREQMIEWLVADDFEIVKQDGAWGYFANTMENGFKGYRRYTDEELRQSILGRDPDNMSSHNLNTEN